MKKRKILLAVLVVALCAGLLCSCQSKEDKMAELAGVWYCRADDTEEQARGLLESIEFYEEEIALVDLTGLDDVMLVEFDAEGNYHFAWYTDGIKECLREFYDGAFAALYDGRATLNDVYGLSFDDYTEEEFYLFYAELYVCADYAELLDVLVEYSYDYDSLGEPFETGTFTIDGYSLMCTITGESEAEALGYKIEGDTLTLTYADAVQVYTRGN